MTVVTLHRAWAVALLAGSMSVSPIDGSAHAADALTLESPTFKEGQPIGNDHFWNNFGCSGANKLPDLAWSAGPDGTQSYAITFYDHDAPTGSGFWHWVVYDIPADVRKIEAAPSLRGQPRATPISASPASSVHARRSAASTATPSPSTP